MMWFLILIVSWLTFGSILVLLLWRLLERQFQLESIFLQADDPSEALAVGMGVIGAAFFWPLSVPVLIFGNIAAIIRRRLIESEMTNEI